MICQRVWQAFTSGFSPRFDACGDMHKKHMELSPLPSAWFSPPTLFHTHASAFHGGWQFLLAHEPDSIPRPRLTTNLSGSSQTIGIAYTTGELFTQERLLEWNMFSRAEVRVCVGWKHTLEYRRMYLSMRIAFVCFSVHSDRVGRYGYLRLKMMDTLNINNHVTGCIISCLPGNLMQSILSSDLAHVDITSNA
jgi:hypothetical protein